MRHGLDRDKLYQRPRCLKTIIDIGSKKENKHILLGAPTCTFTKSNILSRGVSVTLCMISIYNEIHTCLQRGEIP